MVATRLSIVSEDLITIGSLFQIVGAAAVKAGMDEVYSTIQ